MSKPRFFPTEVLFGGLIFGLLCITKIGWAQPDFRTKLQIGNMALYQDYTEASTYYYVPLGLSIAIDTKGKPDIHFLQTRYTGTHLHNDQGTKRFRSLLQLRLVQQKPTTVQLDQVKKRLALQHAHTQIFPLPIQHLQVVLVHAVPNPAEDSIHTLPSGFSDAAKEMAEENWQERTYTVRLDEHAAQLFWDAFHQQRTILSIGYAYYARVVNYDSLSQIIIPDDMPEAIKEQLSSTGSDSSTHTKMVAADAFEVMLDTEQWPELMQQIDINENIPPAFAALDIYCYDFNNQLRPDLYAKRVEVQTPGVAGGMVQQRIIFRHTEPEHYAETLHFPFAVRLDSPFQYRITEIFKDGHQQKSEWIMHSSWYDLLDVTSASSASGSDTDY